MTGKGDRSGRVLVRPGAAHLASYADALRRGWAPDNLRPQSADLHLEQLTRDPAGFLASLDDPEATGPAVQLPDGSTVPRLPSLRRWMWQGEFCGAIGLRWQPGTEDLPPTCLGHIGYGVVPWRRREGWATAALREMLPLARAVGLAHVDLTTDRDNGASIRVIAKAGGRFVRTFVAPKPLGGGHHALYRIDL